MQTPGAVVGAVAISQNALDRNLRQGSGGRNFNQRPEKMAAPIYTVNRNTGELAYNRSNAFRDPSYNIYQGWQHKNFDALKANPRGADNSARRLQSRPRAPPDLAFGALGRDPDVGPNETIIIDVELHEVLRD